MNAHDEMTDAIRRLVLAAARYEAEARQADEPPRQPAYQRVRDFAAVLGVRLSQSSAMAVGIAATKRSREIGAPVLPGRDHCKAYRTDVLAGLEPEIRLLARLAAVAKPEPSSLPSNEVAPTRSSAAPKPTPRFRVAPGCERQRIRGTAPASFARRGIYCKEN